MAADTEKGTVSAPSAASAEPHASPVHYVLVIIAFLALNSAINMLNRWVLGVYGFRCEQSLSLHTLLDHGSWGLNCWSLVTAV